MAGESKKDVFANRFLAGALAGMSVEAVLFPLDCVKTRVQSPAGFVASGGFRGAYRGVGTAIVGAAPASAIFFSTYELTKSALAPRGGEVFGLHHCGSVVVAAVCGELAACSVRVPVDLVKQRLQAGLASDFMSAARSVSVANRAVIFASFRATAVRDVGHSSLQFPMYEFLKISAAKASGCSRVEELPAYQAAVCGSVAGALSAVLTTPMDLVKTRLNLRSPDASGNGGNATVSAEISKIYRTEGVSGLFTGATYRAIWMAMGGFVFLGSFEFAKDRLVNSDVSDEPMPVVRGVSATRALSGPASPATRQAQPRAPSTPETERATRHLGLEPPAWVLFTSGLMAGISVDVPLHPLDTVKTRLQSRDGLRASGGFRGLWNGLSAVLMMSVPASVVFFTVYEHSRHVVERYGPQDAGGVGAALRDASAAAVADVSACVVRVPCEIVKQRMQTAAAGSASGSLGATLSSVNVEGIRGFYAGFGATIVREVPFALIQMPLFEELKYRHPWHAEAERKGDTFTQGVVGTMCGGVAGAIAGALTTPFDAAKTRIMLTTCAAERQGVLRTILDCHREHGLSGVFRGFVPRTLHSAIGGALWLGAFEWSKLLLGATS